MNSDYNSILLVGPYTPRQCGIATHVIQLEQVLKGEGWIVDTLGPLDCNSSYKVNLTGGLNSLKLLKYAHKYKVVNIHFDFGEFFYSGRSMKRLLNIFPLFALWVLFRRMKNINVVMHEQPPARFFIQRTFFQRWVWNQAGRITFFTMRERDIFLRKYKLPYSSNQHVVEAVNKNFITYSRLSRNEARTMLGLVNGVTTILCIGFIQWNKGFERLAKIFRERSYQNLLLYIVGSVRKGDAEAETYYNSLSALCEGTGNIMLINKYLSDEDFDIWINASDYVALPYVRISNSGVLGRARLLNIPAIVSDIGGLGDQIGENDQLFSTDTELQAIIDRIAAQSNVSRV